MSLAPLLLVSRALALDVLVPELTPRTLSDLGSAEALTDSIVRSSRNAGLDIGDPELLSARAGVGAIGCAENLSCPGNLWARFPEARLTVVGLVGTASEGVALEVRFYAWNQSRPLDELSLTVAPGAETAAGARVAERAAQILATLPPPEAVPLAPAPVATQPVPPVVAEPPPPRVVIIGPPAPQEPEEDLHLPPWDEARFQASGLDADTFRRRYHVRTGHAGLELWGAGVFGDIGRYYDARLALSDDGGERTQTGAYQYSTFRNQAGGSFGLNVTYAPICWAEAVLSLGTQLGRQEQVVGYEVTKNGERTDIDRVVFTPGLSALMMVEPGFRVMPLTTGPVKPYGLIGMNLRFFPGYPATTYGGLDYPALSGGVSLGPTLGLGLGVDAGKRGTGFLEVPWTLILLPSPGATGAALLTTLPDEPLGVGQVLSFKAGAGLRF